jgi:PAS domain S-box-containing protein
LARAKQPDIPFILISGTLGDEQAVDCVLRGATDYVLKQRLERLVPAVLRALTEAEEHQKRRKAEETLLLAHERLRRFVDSNIVGIVIAEAAGAIIEANDYYLRLIGYTREELEHGKVDWRAITPPEWLPADEQAIRELRARGNCTPYEKEYVRRDGTRVPVFLADTMLPGPGEQIAAFALDITERKQAEGTSRRQTEELRARNEELARFNNAAVGRELRMVELKQQINELCRQLGKPTMHPLAFPDAESQPSTAAKLSSAENRKAKPEQS